MSALGYDSVPGDVDAVQRVAAMLGGVAGQAEIVTTRLAKLDQGLGAQIWRGPAAEVFHSILRDVGPDVRKLVDAHREAEDALRTYASALGAAQGAARRAGNDAARATADRDRAECERRRAAEEAETHQSRVNECRIRIGQARVARLTALTDPVYQAEMDRYENQIRGIQRHAETGAVQARSQENSARTAGSEAEARVEAARLLSSQATELRDHAARRVVDRLDAAGPAGRRENPITRFWTNAKEVVREFATSPKFLDFLAYLDRTASILSLLGGIAMLVPFLQPIGGILLGASAILGMLSLAGTVLAALHGKRTAADVARGVLSLVPGLKISKKVPPGALGIVVGGLGKVKRVFKFDGRAPTALNKIPIAPEVGGFEKVIMTHGRIDPRTHYRGRVLIDMANGWNRARENVETIVWAAELGRRQVAPAPVVGTVRRSAPIGSGPELRQQET